MRRFTVTLTRAVTQVAVISLSAETHEEAIREARDPEATTQEWMTLDTLRPPEVVAITEGTHDQRP